MKLILLAAAAFLVGSIPTGQIIAGVRGLDLRKTGSGNIGATNVLRSAGIWPALLTLLGDVLKGVTAVLLGRYFFAGRPSYEGIMGVCAILGHDFSIFLKFKGGKGVATGIGVLSVYSPQAAVFTIIIWLMTVTMSRYSSLGALVSFGLMPAGVAVFDGTGKLPAAFLISILVFIRHKDNIARLVKGTETKVGRRT